MASNSTDVLTEAENYSNTTEPYLNAITSEQDNETTTTTTATTTTTKQNNAFILPSTTAALPFSTVTLSAIDSTYIIIGIFGIICNALALVVICTHKQIRQRLANYYLINQIFVDFIVCCLIIPTFVPYYGYATWYLCMVWESRVFFLSFYTVSIYSMLALAVERYLEVVHPIWHRLKVSRNKVILSIMAVWLTAFSEKAVHLLTATRPIGGVCYLSSVFPSLETSRLSGLVNCIVDFIFPIFLSAFCYIEMFRHLRVKVKPQLASAPATATGVTAPPAAPNGLSRARKNIIITLLIVLSIFIGFNLLKQSILIVKYTGIAPVSTSSVIFNCGQILAAANSTVEPLIYLVYHREFKNGFRKLFRLNVGGAQNAAVKDLDASVATGAYSLQQKAQHAEAG